MRIPGVVTGGGGLDLEASIAFEDVDEQLHNFRIVVDDKNFGFAVIKDVEWDAVVLHELDERFARNPPEATAGNAEALEATTVKATNDGLLRDLADVGSFSRSEHCLHCHSIHRLDRH